MKIKLILSAIFLLAATPQTMKEFLAEYGIDIGLLLSGTFGGLLFASKSNKKTFREQITGIVGGAATANYLTPLAVDWFKINNSTQFAIAFMLGYAGLKGVEFFTDKFFNKDIKKEEDGGDTTLQG